MAPSPSGAGGLPPPQAEAFRQEEPAEWVLGVLDPGADDVLLTSPAGKVVAVVRGDTGAVVRVRP
jgi:hypothetical protein